MQRNLSNTTLIKLTLGSWMFGLFFGALCLVILASGEILSERDAGVAEYLRQTAMAFGLLMTFGAILTIPLLAVFGFVVLMARDKILTHRTAFYIGTVGLAWAHFTNLTQGRSAFGSLAELADSFTELLVIGPVIGMVGAAMFFVRKLRQASALTG